MPVMALLEPVPVPMLKTVPCAEIAVDAMIDLSDKRKPAEAGWEGEKESLSGLVPNRILGNHAVQIDGCFIGFLALN
jgi:hypothetical protein